jgi:hypothetical protein
VENFDGPPPALPAGWTAELVSGDPPTWETTGSTPDGGNGNNLFVDDQKAVSEKRVVSRDITINSASSVLSFRNNYNTEYDPPPAEVFWDGYVLDISTDGGGTYNDVIAAGGTFVSGAYTGELTGVAENPLAGRMAWCGSSGGYIDTVINLPASLNGQTIKLRFVMGTDQAAARPGAHVDVLTITNASCP